MRALSMAVVLVAAVFQTAYSQTEVNDRTEINMDVFIPCAMGGIGESVTLTGSLHTLITFNINGNIVTGTYHFQPQGVVGFGKTSGDKYQGTGVSKQSFTTYLRDGQSTDNWVNNFRIIGQGPGNNYLVHGRLHVTIYADGTAKVLHDDVNVECK